MAYKVVMSESAEYDLEQILNYLTVKLYNPIAATNFVNKLESCFNLLSEQPKIYALSNQEYLNKLGYHKCVIDHYVMLYRINEDKQEIVIMRIFYGKQDYIKYL
ncbi:type II toxin-antitoxin system RelE/ParE family toxin [Erysipelotrichaceae bacterium AF15-26LB]|nr:addiction module toxin, RelE/StbE family [Erysipelotrichaceae bacterium 3_1_53]MCR0349208.1 type II toxin-antitoxin system RelE/ParE family toxin [[Clostridium] innocuum]RJV86949.1 type II toxin-antitoxin system RelE/ParE family toxin [Erysipelotrichaceae bacterium AF15-26LB]RJV91634.1 type II toxin-antitoxin system RelE/ParE family toxin [Erysipelotrichaceae bacterium AF19-24AC]